MAQTLLVADDSKTMRRVVTMAFKGTPYRVVTASSGAETLQAAYEHRPSVILLDYHLPDRSGLDVCRAIKGDPSLRNIPVVMLGGKYHPFDQDAAKNNGADEIILKPFKTDKIQEMVKKVAGASGGVVEAPAAPVAPPSAPAARAPSSTMMGMPALGTPRAAAPAAAPRQPSQAQARYNARLPSSGSAPRKPPARMPSPPRSSPGSSSRYPGTTPPSRPPARVPTPPVAPKPPSTPIPPVAPAPPAAAPFSKDEIRQMVREEVQAAVRKEMLSMVKSVLGDLFKEKMMPKLLGYGQERVEAMIARDLQVIMERRVEEELAKFTQG